MGPQQGAERVTLSLSISLSLSLSALSFSQVRLGGGPQEGQHYTASGSLSAARSFTERELYCGTSRNTALGTVCQALWVNGTRLAKGKVEHRHANTAQVRLIEGHTRTWSSTATDTGS